ncbi:Acetyltransferase [Candidatus Terasakiella magnetica]|nr:Acetyltransferase [Candidatus Terasakiella magnetica]
MSECRVSTDVAAAAPWVRGAVGPAARRIALRQEWPTDTAFLHRLYATTRAEEMAASGWPALTCRQFLADQFQAQDSHYRRVHPAAARHIVLVQRQRAGRLYLGQAADEIRIIDISLLPAAQGKAIGTALIRAVQENAAAQGCRLALSVVIGNSAERLYLRLGFCPLFDGAGRREMVWRPADQTS